ncbi:hypothetical protein F5Y15DRAFT_389521 [Xylariaceae sp. FL0016]|nr:hypothetical protein F5Y15DRAFT_389521 [Xylariaceae sp. FL0016]
MLFTSFWKAPAAAILIALIGQSAALPYETRSLIKRAEKIIGYRRVSPAEGQAIVDNNNKFTDDGSSANGQQIGAGKYTAMGPDTYIIDEGEPDWYCIITAESSVWQSLSKAWVPEAYWFQSADAINGYITKLDGNWDPAKTIRMSSISGQDDDDYQMVIPPALVTDAALNVIVRCYQTRDALPTTKEIDYDGAWDNVDGEPDEDITADSDAESDSESDDDDDEDDD